MKFKKLPTVVLSVLILFSTLSVGVFVVKATTCTISTNKTEYKIDETFTITINITADEAMYATEAYVTFDCSVISFVSGGSANEIDDGKVKIVGIPAGSPSQSYSLTFKTLKEGNTTVTVSDVSYVGEDSNKISGASPLRHFS